MTTVNEDFGSGGEHIDPVDGKAPTLALTFRDIADDLAEIKAKQDILLAKLDLDAGITDTNYAALAATTAFKTIKG